MDGRWMALAVLTTARASLGVQFQSVASVSAPLIEGFGLSYADLGLLVGLYFLPGIVIALPGGALGRRFGDTRMVLAGLVLMAAGGAMLAAAEGPATLFAGRLLSGVGAVLLNVLMAKMVTDWFAGREIVLAMAIFVNSFPIGVGLAMLALGAIQDAAGWRTAMLVAAGTAALAFVLVLLAYRPHPGTTEASAATTRSRLSRREVAKVSVAGVIWGIYNGAFAITFAFAPAYLAAAGTAHVGLLLGVVAWLMVASVQAGGLLAQRWGRPGLLMALGVGAWGMGLVLLPWLPPVPVLLMIGLLQGLPVGVIMSLPAVALRPENRALGMGVFYTWLYVGHAGLPPLAGWVQDASGHPAGALLLAGAVVLGIVPLFLLFRALPGAEPARPG